MKDFTEIMQILIVKTLKKNITNSFDIEGLNTASYILCKSKGYSSSSIGNNKDRSGRGRGEKVHHHYVIHKI